MAEKKPTTTKKEVSKKIVKNKPKKVTGQGNSSMSRVRSKNDKKRGKKMSRGQG